MKVQKIVEEAADTLRGLELLAQVPVIEEDKGNVATELETAIGKTSLCVVVGWNGFKPRIVGETAPGETPFGDITVVVSVFERPVVNRKNAASPRLLDIAQEAAKALDGASAEGMDDAMHLTLISHVEAIGNGDVVMCTVEFKTAGTL